jgi:hypothetical protein
MKTRYVFSYILFLFMGISTLCAQEISIPLRFDRYYTYEEINEALSQLHSRFPKITQLDEVGKSEEGRKIMALTISAQSTGNHFSKPGIYVDGNIHGNEIQAGEVCLYLANYLLTKYDDNETIRNLVNRVSFYIIPSVNVDGRWHFMNEGNTPSSNRSIRIAKDDDGDGLFDEDGYDDLDNDGNICQMRMKDPDGKLKTDPEDDRLMTRIKPDEKGEWNLLGYEGIDNDNDGQFNEDAEGYLDPNRNWPFDWKPDFVQNGAGKFPFSGVGLKAVGQYIEAHPNILVVWAFHNNGGMFLRGPSSKELIVPKPDIDVYDLLGTNAEKMVPGYKYMPSYDLYPTYGDFGEFTYNLMGAYTFVGELFKVESETFNKEAKAPTEQQALNRERLKYNDYLTHGELYKEWKPYKHPQYGDIEIGGWVKMSSRLPHPSMLQELVHRNASAVIYSASQLPQLEMEVFSKEKIDRDTYKIKVRIRNTKGIPTMTTHSWQKKLYPPDQLVINGATVIKGGEIKNRFTNEVLYKEYKPSILFTRIDGFDKKEFEFIVTGKGKIEIEYRSQKANNLKQSIDL